MILDSPLAELWRHNVFHDHSMRCLTVFRRELFGMSNLIIYAAQQQIMHIDNVISGAKEDAWRSTLKCKTRFIFMSKMWSRVSWLHISTTIIRDNSFSCVWHTILWRGDLGVARHSHVMFISCQWVCQQLYLCEFV